mgnify:CR=1 FL=1
MRKFGRCSGDETLAADHRDRALTKRAQDRSAAGSHRHPAALTGFALVASLIMFALVKPIREMLARD